MKYEWDDAKNQKNIAKHGLNFEDVDQVFSGPCVTFEDDRFAYGKNGSSLWACWLGVWLS